MPAIPVHHTDVVDRAWDGGAQVKALGDAPTERALRLMHAWVDPDADPETKAAYKFPHHMVSDGEVGAANVKACQSIISVLNGGMGGADIPDSDRRGVYNHAAAHLRDADVEPAPLRSARGGVRPLERRCLPLTALEVRASSDHWAVLEGHASVFGTEAVIWGLWREEVAPGAFAKTIKEHEIYSFFNHDSNMVLGNTRAGTLILEEDEKGLHTLIYPPDNEWGRPVVDAIRRGDVTGMSIQFDVIKHEWQKGADGELPKRTIREMRLYEAGPVTFPAFETTDISVRSTRIAGISGNAALERAKRLAIAAECGYELTESDRNLIQSGLNELELVTIELRNLAGGEPTAGHSHLQSEPSYAHSVAARARELEVLELTLRRSK